MIIISRYAGKCKVCGGPINVNDAVEWTAGEKGVKHPDSKTCEYIKKNTPAASPAIPSIDLSMKPVCDVMQQVGLKKPTLRLKGVDSEVVLSLTRQGVAPGSVAVKVGGVFMGCIRPSGECTSLLKSPARESLRKYLLETVTDKNSLIQAAIEYAKLTNNCSFCGLGLTNDYSVVVGYGPICAENWGLPHALNGTAEKIRIDGMSDTQHAKYMKLLVDGDE